MIQVQHSGHIQHIRLATVGAAFAATIAFHFFLAERAYGIALALFVFVLIIGVHALLVVDARRGNLWAYVFLIPVFAGMAAEIMYASWTMRTIAFPVIFCSFALFAYWVLVKPESFWSVPKIVSKRLMLDTVLPFKNFGELFGFFGTKRSGNVIKGIIISIPFLIIFAALFASADKLFGMMIEDLFRIERMPEYVWELIRDFFVGIFILGFFWTLVRSQRAPEEAKEKNLKEKSSNQTAISTFLFLVNFLFAVFLAFQFVYFFGGEEVVQSAGITYSEYARQGFFQLLTASGIVFAISMVLYRLGDLRKKYVFPLSLLLILQTGVVLASSMSRLLLYIDEFGLTVSRFWAFIVIVFVGAVLLALLVSASARVRYMHFARGLGVVSLVVLSGLLLWNVEGTVARVNVDRFLSGKTDTIDIYYLGGLSSDAVPNLVRLANSEWPVDVVLNKPRGKRSVTSAQDSLRLLLLEKRRKLESRLEKNWRNGVLSDYRALAELRKLTE